LQFHGNENADECGGYSRPYIKALRMRPDLDLNQEMLAYASARGVLLDAYTPGIPGGTGEKFDWSRIPAHLAAGITLAGGLDSSNVAAAVDQVRPYAIDVSGGVEQSKGIKDAEKLKQFIAEVHRVNNS
jgi:phosphoribosylanthranilate isomerase